MFAAPVARRLGTCLFIPPLDREFTQPANRSSSHDDSNAFTGTAAAAGRVLASRQLRVGRQIYLYDNPLLKRPLELAHVKRSCRHWGTVPGQNFIYVHLTG